MAVGCTFDQWRADAFFAAAEEVQESADVMESVYRMWTRERDGLAPSSLDDLHRELQTAFGTAKWQLEEFEKAVRLSHTTCLASDNVITRHKEFIDVIASQISSVEKALSQSSIVDGSAPPLNWVQLDDEERNVLAAFLSAPLKVSQNPKDVYGGVDPSLVQVGTTHDSIKGFKDTLKINKDARFVVQVEAKEPSQDKVGMYLPEELNGPHRLSSSPDISAWKIVVADEDDVEKRLVDAKKETPRCASNVRGPLRSVESAKPSWFGRTFPKRKGAADRQLKRGLLNHENWKQVSRLSRGVEQKGNSCLCINMENTRDSDVQQLVVKGCGIKGHLQSSHVYKPYGCSAQVTLLLVLAIFLAVPFLLYST